MADLRQVRTRLASAHTAIETAAALLGDINYIEDRDAEYDYMQRELHKILGRLEALEAGISARMAVKGKKPKFVKDVLGTVPMPRSMIEHLEAGGEDASTV